MGVFVALGDYDKLYYSSDPIDRPTWKRLDVGENNIYWTSVTTDGKKVAMVGYSYTNTSQMGWTSTSIDGITWTTPKVLGTTFLRAVTYGNGYYIAVGNQGYITSSIDGINWTTPAQLVSESNLRGICIMP